MIKKTTLRLDFSFFAVLSIFFFFDSGGGLAALSACAVHELSHLTVMLICGVPVQCVTFYGAGIRISAKLSCERSSVRLWSISAGVIANLFFAAVFYLLGEYMLSAVNLVTGLFNLLPIGEFDGAALAKEAVLRLAPPEKADLIMFVLEVLSFAVCITAVLFFSGDISVTLLVTLVYLLTLMCRQI